MQINRTKKFRDEFKKIIFYIAKDKKSAAKTFKNQLNNNINNLSSFPYKYRRSIYFNNENIRDMIFKNYTIIYEVDNNSVNILTIFNKNKP